MSYKLKALFFKPKSIEWAISSLIENRKNLKKNQPEYLHYMYKGWSLDKLNERLNRNLVELQESQNNYFEGICVLLGIFSTIFQVSLFFQLWNYENIASIRFFLINMFISPMCLYFYLQKKREERFLMKSCLELDFIINERKIKTNQANQ